MTESVDRQRWDGRPDELNRRADHDLRDDFDDELRLVHSPTEIARRRLLIPGIAFIAIGVLGIIGMMIASFFVILDYVQSGRGSERMWILILVLFLLLLAACLFLVVIAGGVSLMQVRRYRVAMGAAYIVTALTLGGPYGVLFFPFGIWALILLYRPDIRMAFRRPVRVDV